MACRPGEFDYKSLLTGWYKERKQQLEKSLAATIENGEYITQSNPFKIFIRDWYLWSIQLIPSWRHWLEMGQRREGMIRYNYEPGMAFIPDLGGGFSFPQIYCIDLCNGYNDTASRVRFTDDAIFDHWKQALFQVVVLNKNLAEAEAAKKSLQGLEHASEGELREHEATYIIHDLSVTPAMNSYFDVGLFRIATGTEFAETRLCHQRPEPQFYDPFRMMKEAQRKPFLILRPDRFVYAACADRNELFESARRLAGFLRSM